MNVGSTNHMDTFGERISPQVIQEIQLSAYCGRKLQARSFWSGHLRTPMLRMLQVPELKRAMGFDNGYTLPYGSRRDRIKLLGNGVCPPVMEAAIRALTQKVGLLEAAE